MTKLIEVHTDKYARWVFDATHPTQGRRFLNAHEQLHGLADKTVTITTVEPEFEPGIGILRLAHDEGYVDSVAKGFSGEWEGCRTDLGALALKMCGGTLVALDGLLNPTPETEGVKTAVHFAGAKHHAQFSESSGFCVLADFAIAAHLATRQGLRVAILDWDAHHGDGTENLTYNNSEVLTFSIHDETIFPGTGSYSVPEMAVFNAPLPNGSGDVELANCVENFIDIARQFEADIIFLAMGADGLANDPLSSLTFTIDGLVEQAKRLRAAFPDMPFLLGGAGGYQPDSETPECWARVALAVASG